MSVFTPAKQEQIRVPNSKYIKSEDESDTGDTQPSEPETPDEQPKEA
jgi:hypothetical protein